MSGAHVGFTRFGQNQNARYAPKKHWARTRREPTSGNVMPGFMPGIHDFPQGPQDVDGRDKARP
jgi:hypothetical protein